MKPSLRNYDSEKNRKKILALNISKIHNSNSFTSKTDTICI